MKTTDTLRKTMTAIVLICWLVGAADGHAAEGIGIGAVLCIALVAALGG